MFELPNPLPGYEPAAFPADVPLENAKILVQLLVEARFTQVGGCMGFNRDTVANMSREIEGSHRITNSGLTDQVVGPLVLGQAIKSGNTIGIWQRTENL